MKNVGRKVFLFITAFILGMVVTMQVRTIASFNDQKNDEDVKIEVLKKELTNEKNAIEEIQEKIRMYEEERENYLKAFIEGNEDESLKETKEQLDKIRLRSGLVDVKGPGILIKMDDAPSSNVNFSPETLLIHDNDVHKILNDLKKAGAQAISINGERIISTTEQICAGPTIRINNRRYAVPYEIRAIGDTKELFESIIESPTVVLMEQVGIQISIEKKKDIEIPRYNYSISKLIKGLEVPEE